MIIKKNFFYLFILLYSIAGIYLSLQVGITHDEFIEFTTWENNKKIYQNYILGTNNSINFLEKGAGYYGFGFHIISTPIELLVNLILKDYQISEYGKNLIIKHPSVFLFFVISGIYFKKILFIITKNNFYSKICAILFLLYPYLLGHSFFNIKDVPFMSVWLICSYYILNFCEYFYKEKKVSSKKVIILSILTAYLLSIRISGVLIFIQYLIFLLVYAQSYNQKKKEFFQVFLKHIVNFILLTTFVFFLLHPNYWDNPFKVFESIKYMSQHIQTVCTITLGECMKAQSLPASYIPIWMFFKLPILIIFSLILFPLVEKDIFTNKERKTHIGSIIFTILLIIFLLIVMKVNLYDELRHIIFLIPLIFIVGLSFIYFFMKKIAIYLVSLFIFVFLIENIKIFPYNYIWLNNFSSLTKINKSFELDYWGVSTKKIAHYLKENNIDKKGCIISNRNDAIKSFLNNEERCFLPFRDLHKKNKRPFYVILMERNRNKGHPNSCNNIHNETVSINYSNEKLILAKIYECY